MVIDTWDFQVRNPNLCWNCQAGLPALNPVQVLGLLLCCCREGETSPLPQCRAAADPVCLLGCRPPIVEPKVEVMGAAKANAREVKFGSGITTGPSPASCYHSACPWSCPPPCNAPLSGLLIIFPLPFPRLLQLSLLAVPAESQDGVTRSVHCCESTYVSGGCPRSALWHFYDTLRCRSNTELGLLCQ